LTEAHARAAARYIAAEVKNVTWRVNPYDPHAAVAAAMSTHEDTTHVLELSGDFDAAFRTWSKGHRAAVKQARRERITVRAADGIDDWRAYYGAYQDSVRRWGESASTVYRWSLFEELARGGSKHVRLWLAERDGRIAAGSLCFYAKRHVVYWHGAAYEEFFKMRPVNLLIYEAARAACDDGYRWFDFNPSGGLEGVRAFKKSFGTVELPCPVVRLESKLLRALRALRGRG
jgi:predicted N-acyltransferase